MPLLEREMAVINCTDQVIEPSNSAVQLMVDQVLEILSKVLEAWPDGEAKTDRVDRQRIHRSG